MSQVILLISWYLGIYLYIGGLPSRVISKLLSLDFPLLGEIPSSSVCSYFVKYLVVLQ